MVDLTSTKKISPASELFYLRSTRIQSSKWQLEVAQGITQLGAAQGITQQEE